MCLIKDIEKLSEKVMLINALLVSAISLFSIAAKSEIKELQIGILKRVPENDCTQKSLRHF